MVFETMARRKISERMVKQLLKDGRTATVKNFKSRQGKPFDAALQWDADQGKVKFLFDRTPKPKSKPASGGSKRPTSGPEGTRCPECTQGTIIRGRTAFGCDRWRDGCSYRIPFQQ